MSIENNIIPVMICGAGPVGLSLGLALSRFGIQNLIVEKHPGTSIHPKARGVNVRTMELFRLWKVEQSVRSHEHPKNTRQFMWRQNTLDHVIGKIAIEDQHCTDSPTDACFVLQDKIEQELLSEVEKHAESEIRFSTELINFTQEDTFVRCEFFNRETKKSEIVNCQYLIAADGAYSPIRKAENIEMQGLPNLGNYISIFCEADLTPWLAKEPAVVSVFVDPEFRTSVIMSVDLKKKWIIAKRFPDASYQLNHEEAVKMVQDMVPENKLNIKIINISSWEMAGLNSEQYQKGRVLLVGDAAHRLPPTGGMGMNTGIQDAHNLAWKLAYVINGHATPELLLSYEQERKPLAQYTIDWSCRNSERISGIIGALQSKDTKVFQEKLETQRQQINHRGLDLGYVYCSGAIYNENSPQLEIDPDIYSPSAAPGARAPHCFIKINDKTVSTLDLFEKEFVLFAGEKANLDSIKRQLPIPENFPLKCYQIGRDFNSNEFSELFQIGPAEAVLVRPDGHIACRLGLE